MKFATIVFRAAGVWGLLALLPMYFLGGKLGEQAPPALTHTEFYFGFVSIALVFQFVFFIIANDPMRFRPIMPFAILEKLAFAIPFFVVSRNHAVSTGEWIGALADCVLVVLFLLAWLRTPTPGIRRR